MRSTNVWSQYYAKRAQAGPVRYATYTAPATAPASQRITEAEHAQLWRDLHALGAKVPQRHMHYITSKTTPTKPGSDPNDPNAGASKSQDLEIVNTLDKIADKLLLLQNRIDTNTQGIDRNKSSIATVREASLENARAIGAILKKLDSMGGPPPAKKKPSGDPNS